MNQDLLFQDSGLSYSKQTVITVKITDTTQVTCRTEAVNLSRSLETCKMLKIILSKRKRTKLLQSVIPYQTLFQYQLGFAIHLT